MSIEIIKKLFGKTKKSKIEFKPEIRVVLSNNSIVWIDNIFLNRDQLMVTLSTTNDKFPSNLNAADHEVIQATARKLRAEYGHE